MLQQNILIREEKSFVVTAGCDFCTAERRGKAFAFSSAGQLPVPAALYAQKSTLSTVIQIKNKPAADPMNPDRTQRHLPGGNEQQVNPKQRQRKATAANSSQFLLPLRFFHSIITFKTAGCIQKRNSAAEAFSVHAIFVCDLL